MPKPPFPCNAPSKENSLIATSNHASPQPHSPPIIDPYVDVVLLANQKHNKTQPQLPPSLTREMLIDDINQLQDLSNLLAMHLSNHTTNPTPPAPILPHTITFDQVEQHETVLYLTEVNVVNENEPLSSEKVVGKLLRKRNKGKALVEPYMVLASTATSVPFVKVLKKRNKRNVKRLQSTDTPIPFDADYDPDVFFISLEEWESVKFPKYQKTKDALPQTQTESNITIFGPDMEAIPLVEFQEDLSRAPYSRRTKVKLPECIDMVYALGGKTTHKFPWGNSKIFVDRTFWLTLLGLNEGNSGWLTDKENMEEVFSSINEPEEHCCLGMLHIKTSFITLYDSLGILDDETRKWWSHMSYNIKLVVGMDVPIQGDAYGDCGTDNQEKDEKQSQNDKTGLGMEKTVKDKAKSKPESQSSQKVNRKVNWSKSKSTQVNPEVKVKEI
ncbi:phospholipase-like protein [Tanacetum coccineum]